jgi:hypothetical protein
VRVELKAYGRGKSVNINNAAGEVRLRASGENDAKVLANLGFLVQYPDMMAALLEVSTALICNRDRVSKRDLKLLGDVIDRLVKVNQEGGES